VEPLSRYTRRPWLSELRDALHSRDWVGSEMHLRATIVQTWMPMSREFRDSLLRCDRVNLGIPSQSVMEQDFRYTWWPWSMKIGGWLGGAQSGSCRLGWSHDGSWDTIYWLYGNCENVESWVQQGPPRDERLAVGGGHLIMGQCGTRCTLYSMYAVFDVRCSWCML